MGGTATGPALFALLLLLAGQAAAETVAHVAINRNLFDPARITVSPGTVVEWLNGEKRTSHSVLFEKEGLAESERMLPGDSWQRKFDKPGIYEYRCGPHPEMRGVVEVVP